jgi:peptidyl-dipeptidase A
MLRRRPLLLLALLPALPLAAVAQTGTARRPTPRAAEIFMRDAEARLLDLASRQQRAQWVQNTYITDDTEVLAAQANDAYIAGATELAAQGRRFATLKLPDSTARKLRLLTLQLELPAPADAKRRGELTSIVASMEGAYGKGHYCPTPDNCLALGDLEKIFARSRNPDSLRMAWLGWHAVSPPYRDRFVRYVALANEGARQMGFADLGAMWRAKYDMPPDQFAAEMERLWTQVKPLYQSLHAYVRARLVQQYGPQLVPPAGPIPAHLLGNMWSQSWENIAPLLDAPSGGPGYDLSRILASRKTEAKDMVRYGEGFFTSLGFDTLPATFWERSLLVKPRDRDVLCHASAWDIDGQSDVRIKMCIEPTAENFATIHHELGHVYYQLAYRGQPFLFAAGANDGFHEAIGDAVALSVTPEYLKRIGLIAQIPDPSADIGLLLDRALEKVAFLPFGYLVDQWRWDVFSGKTPPGDYNRHWWELRTRYQGIQPPAPRSEADFDAGAKAHVASNVPYARYFLAAVLQFQFHRALCREAGYTGPLHRCSIYGNRRAGEKLKAMLALGQSVPWPEALETLTGQREMDASAMAEYFAPLKAWLDEQNRGKPVGWTTVSGER